MIEPEKVFCKDCVHVLKPGGVWMCGATEEKVRDDYVYKEPSRLPCHMLNMLGDCLKYQAIPTKILPPHGL